MLCGVIARVTRKDARRTKHVRPIDSLLPAGVVPPWSNGGPVNVLLSDDDDSDSID